MNLIFPNHFFSIFFHYYYFCFSIYCRTNTQNNLTLLSTRRLLRHRFRLRTTKKATKNPYKHEHFDAYLLSMYWASAIFYYNIFFCFVLFSLILVLFCVCFKLAINNSITHTHDFAAFRLLQPQEQKLA